MKIFIINIICILQILFFISLHKNNKSSNIDKFYYILAKLYIFNYKTIKNNFI